MAEDKDQWQKTSGFAADTAIVQVVVKEDDKKTWFNEADENGYNSTSKYLYEPFVFGLGSRSGEITTHLL